MTRQVKEPSNPEPKPDPEQDTSDEPSSQIWPSVPEEESSTSICQLINNTDMTQSEKDSIGCTEVTDSEDYIYVDSPFPRYRWID